MLSDRFGKKYAGFNCDFWALFEQAIDGLALIAAPLTCTLIVFASVAIPTLRAATVNPSDLFRDAGR
jgi:hypothetical protein